MLLNMWAVSKPSGVRKLKDMIKNQSNTLRRYSLVEYELRVVVRRPTVAGQFFPFNPATRVSEDLNSC